MSDESEIDLDALERSLRQKWKPEQPRPAITFENDEDRQVAAALIGGTNLERAARLKPGQRFRPLALVVYYEWYWFRVAQTGHGMWRVNRVENGRSQIHDEGLDPEELNEVLRRLRAKGADVRRFEQEADRHRARQSQNTGPKKTERKTFAERYPSLGTRRSG